MGNTVCGPAADRGGGPGLGAMAPSWGNDDISRRCPRSSSRGPSSSDEW